MEYTSEISLLHKKYPKRKFYSLAGCFYLLNYQKAKFISDGELIFAPSRVPKLLKFLGEHYSYESKLFWVKGNEIKLGEMTHFWIHK